MKVVFKNVDKVKTSLEVVMDTIIAESRITAFAVADEQRKHILNGTDPTTGGKQKENAESTKAKKKDNPINKPLYKTGLFADSSKWKVRKIKRGLTLKPPKEREGFVRIWKSKGYHTILESGVPSDMANKLLKRIQDRINFLFKRMSK